MFMKMIGDAMKRTDKGMRTGPLDIIAVGEGVGRPVLPAVAQSLKALVKTTSPSHRRHSDDYRMCENGIGCGRPYHIRIGDVSFCFNAMNDRYTIDQVSVVVDQTRVMTYNHTKGEIEFVTQELPALSAHVMAAATTLSGKVNLERVERDLRDLRYERERADRDAATLARFT